VIINAWSLFPESMENEEKLLMWLYSNQILSCDVAQFLWLQFQ